MLTGLKHDPSFGNPLDVLGHNGGFTRFYYLEQIVVGPQAQTLVPRVVSRCKVLLDVDNVTDFLMHFLQQTAFYNPGHDSGQVVHGLLPERVVPANQLIGELVRKMFF